jgi:hypothetical protein
VSNLPHSPTATDRCDTWWAIIQNKTNQQNKSNQNKTRCAQHQGTKLGKLKICTHGITYGIIDLREARCHSIQQQQRLAEKQRFLFITTNTGIDYQDVCEN